MAPRMLITPTLPGTDAPAAGDCARTSTAPAMPAMARAAAGNIILEFTLILLVYGSFRKPETSAKPCRLEDRCASPQRVPQAHCKLESIADRLPSRNHKAACLRVLA